MNFGKIKKGRFMAAVGVIVLLAVVVGVVNGARRVHQPIEFNHKIHAGKLALPCSTCHTGVETGAYATLPSVSICLTCHSAPLSESKEEAKVREYGGEKGDIPWRRHTRMPDHVYFSHRRHVKSGEVPCERCHGKMEEREVPPSKAPVDLAMEDCIDCHEERGASVDCIHCHR